MFSEIMDRKLQFSHFVIGNIDQLIFASARDQYNRVHNFLINQSAGVILEQAQYGFTQVTGAWADYIRKHAESGLNIIPTYHTDRIQLS